MGFKWIIAATAATACSAAQSANPPPEPVVAAPIPDPDPNFVPAPSDPKNQADSTAQEDTSVDEAIANFDRALAHVEAAEQKQVESRCQEHRPGNATAEQRYAWTAACRYTRR